MSKKGKQPCFQATGIGHCIISNALIWTRESVTTYFTDQNEATGADHMSVPCVQSFYARKYYNRNNDEKRWFPQYD